MRLPDVFRHRRAVKRILVTHAWIRGNLGDFCTAKQLLLYLRRNFHGVCIDVVSVPGEHFQARHDIAALADTYMERPFTDDLTSIFPHYDAVINAPGGGLQTAGDRRGMRMLEDARACARLRIPHVFASHSFHSSFDYSALEKSLIVTREPASETLLRSRGLQPIAGADLAFREDVPRRHESTESPPAGHSPAEAGEGRVLLFLRFDHFRSIRRDGQTLFLDERSITLPEAPLVLATSDPLRDDTLLHPLSKQWGVQYLRSPTLDHLLLSIASAAHVISDRYHPVLFARMMGVPHTFLRQEGSLRDEGIDRLLAENSIQTLAAKAHDSLEAIWHYVRFF